MKIWALAAVVLAGCGPVRMDAVDRDRGDRTQRLYTRDDPDGRAGALESAGEDDCREVRRGRWVMSLCPDPDKLRAGVPSLLRFRAEENATDGYKPAAGTLVAVALRHMGEREVRRPAHPEPSVSPVRETSPGNYEATAVFPVEGRWTVETSVTFPGGETMGMKFDVTVAPAAPAK